MAKLLFLKRSGKILGIIPTLGEYLDDWLLVIWLGDVEMRILYVGS